MKIPLLILNHPQPRLVMLASVVFGVAALLITSGVINMSLELKAFFTLMYWVLGALLTVYLCRAPRFKKTPAGDINIKRCNKFSSDYPEIAKAYSLENLHGGVTYGELEKIKSQVNRSVLKALWKSLTLRSGR